jgi:hypothetical protein
MREAGIDEHYTFLWKNLADLDPSRRIRYQLPSIYEAKAAQNVI